LKGHKTERQQAMHVSMVTITWNIILSIFKFFAGIYANSAAMVSDAVHSASDVFSTIIVMVGVRISTKESDKTHPYGHERYESVAALILAIILGVTGIGIGYSGGRNIFSGDYALLAIPGIMALIAAILSIVIKEIMYWYTRATAKRINSGAMMADAWHHRSDALSSVASLMGIAGARLGYPVLDSVACLIISLFIVKVAYNIFMDSISKMTDTACDDALVEDIRKTILKQDGVIRIDNMKTRLFGNKIYVDVDISAPGSITLYEGHRVANKVHDEIEACFPNVKHCMVHVNPLDSSPDKEL
jgi:cation diffusion facilitator family transporter